MDIKILGHGCANCNKMEEMAKKAAADLGLKATIEKITDIAEIMKYTMSTPGLVINGKLRHSGKPLPDLEKVKELIRQEA